MKKKKKRRTKVDPLSNGTRAARPEEPPHASSASGLGDVKQGKITFGLNLSNLVSPKKLL